MSYRSFYLQATDIADKIRSGEYKQVQAQREADTNSGLVARPRQQQPTPEGNSSLDMVAGYLQNVTYAEDGLKKLLSDPQYQGQDFGEGTGKTTSDIQSYRGSKSTEGITLNSENVELGRVAIGIRSAAEALGIDPIDLATVISYETAGTFDPLKSGPTTKWGVHKGLIQFGEPQAKEYGVDWKNPYDSQLGKDGAVVKYLRNRGVKPGMDILDIYSAINAGSPGQYNASDEAAGGAPGTVADKVASMGDHYKKALLLMEGSKPKQRPFVGKKI